MHTVKLWRDPMAHIDSAAIPQVAMAFMNDDHQEAVDMLNTILDSLETGDDLAVTEAMQAFYQHNIEHFAREEEQMLRVNFPPYSCHKGEHERVLEELRGVIEQWNQEYNRELLGLYLNETVVSWFVNHINTMDTVTAMFISRHSA